jgi:ribosomal protein S18 acetylase RimI-like enzyme
VTSGIRAATPADADGIALVHVQSWQSAYRGLIAQEHLDQLDVARRAQGWTRSLTGSDPSLEATLVTVTDEQVTGFAGVGPSRDPDADPARTGEVCAIYLLPQAWGQGLGRDLMTAALARLADLGYQVATLWVLKDNARARRFYEAAGFTTDGSEQTVDIAGSPIDEVRYHRILGSL